MEETKAATQTGLTITGSSDLGASLFEAAQATHRREVQEKVVRTVQSLLKYLDTQRQIESNAKANIAVLEMRIAAIKAGEFTVSRNGDLLLNDEKLAPLGVDK